MSCCLVLVAVAFAQRPGRLVSDTKLDLVVAPGAMLGRALHLWDPQGGFGQVQNQAYGYLFPMGPFFWLGDLLTVPGWVVQRLWWSLILVVAFLGVVKLCAVLGLGTPTSRVVAGFAYALSPRILTTIGPISIEAWPSALVPWVLVPLVVGAARGSPRRAAALSALAVAAVGGVNAAATFVVVPLGALWLLTRTSGPRRRALMIWWPVLVAIGTAWWLVPLLLLGRYSPPFLDFIETSSVTTFPTSVVDVLRGTSHWVPYVDPSWQAGNDLLTTGYVLLDTGVLLLLGIAGLMIRRNPHRQFLLLSLLLGLVAVTAGHGGAVSGWFDEATRSALDGVLAPLRNVHKFDAWLRLPLVLGVAHLLGSVTPRPADRPPGRAPELGDRLTYLGVLVVAVVALVGSAAPALTGRLAPSDDFERLPDYWTEAAGWLDDHTSEANGVALLVPGTSFATYQWGTPEDEPLQPLAGSRWAVRNAVPLAPPGNIRMLDAIEERLVTGRPSDGLASYLVRAGVEHLVVRNDLRPDEDLPAPGLVHQALEESPGIRQVASFGPRTGGQVRLDLREDAGDTDDDEDPDGAQRDDEERDGRRELVGSGWEGRYRAVEIYAVTGGPSGGATGAARIGEAVTVVGGPEDLLRLIDAGLLGDEPAILAVDADESPDSVLLTDGLRRREANFARIRSGRSATLPAGDPGRRGAPARDYLVGDGRWETVSELSGVRSLSVSGSRAFADTSGPVRPENLPFAAFDGLVDTMWDSGPVRDAERAWLEVELDEAMAVPQVSVAVGRTDQPDDEPGRAASFRVITDAGPSEVQSAVPGAPVTVALPEGTTTTVRVEAARDGRQLSVAELVVPGVDPDRTLVMPEVPSSWGAPEGILVDAGNGLRRGCVRVGPDVRCAPDGDRRGEEPGFVDRTIRLGTGGDYALTVTARPVAGNPLLGLVQDGLLVAAQASSSAVTDPRGSAFAAIDGDGGTSWLADPADPAPTLEVRWLGERRISGIRLGLDPQAAAAPARRVRLEFPGGSRIVSLDDRGRGRFVPFTTSRLDVEVLSTRRAVSLGPDGSATRLGAGVSELRLRGTGLLPAPPLSDVPVDVGCAFGPTVRIGSAFYPTSVVASPRQLAAGEDVPARLCGPDEVRVGSGSTRLVLGPAPAFRPIGAVLRRSDLGAEPVLGTAAPVDVSWIDTVSRHVSFAAAATERVLTLPENANPGWEATLADGDEVEPVTVDGWQQGWRVPADASQLSVGFAPDGLYRAALLGGGALLAGLVLLVLGPAVTALLGRRRRVLSRDEAPAVSSRDLPRVVVVGLGALALGLVAGWVGLLIGVGVGVVLTPRIVRERLPEPILVIVCCVPLAAAVGVALLRPWGSDEGWAGVLAAPQLLALVTVAAVVAGEPTRPGPTFFSRRAGRSTSR